MPPRILDDQAIILRIARLEAELSRPQLAKASNGELAYEQILAIETGAKTIRRFEIDAYARALRVDPNRLTDPNGRLGGHLRLGIDTDDIMDHRADPLEELDGNLQHLVDNLRVVGRAKPRDTIMSLSFAAERNRFEMQQQLAAARDQLAAIRSATDQLTEGLDAIANSC